MKNLLKYLIPILMIAAFSHAAGRSESSSLDSFSSVVHAENSAFAGSFSSPDHDVSIPRQISTVTTYQQANSKRTACLHAMPLFEIVKSGKAFNISVICSTQRNSVILNSSIIEHSHKLVCLGKLVI